ncbi:MAG: DUF1501 domain-containing protein, partial [Planctomycetota bacterium]
MINRRELLSRCGIGMGALALSDLLTREASASLTHFPAKAKRVIHLFMNGGPSQVDTFDYKPNLNKFHGKTAPIKNLKTERPTGNVMGSPFKFQQ